MAKEVDDFYHTIRMGELPHFTCLSCYQAVSYTHLDVYKRQTYGFMLKENPRSYVYCADLRCRENDPPAVRLQTLRAFREHLAQSEGRIEPTSAS